MSTAQFYKVTGAGDSDANGVYEKTGSTRNGRSVFYNGSMYIYVNKFRRYINRPTEYNWVFNGHLTDGALSSRDYYSIEQGINDTSALPPLEDCSWKRGNGTSPVPTVTVLSQETGAFFFASS